MNHATKMARMLLSSTCEEQRSVVRFLWAKGHKPSDIHRDMQGVYGDDCMDRSNVSRWCAFFTDGRVSLCDAPRSGRPVTAASPQNVGAIEAAILNDRRVQLRTLSQRFNISYGTVYDIVHDTLKFRKVSARWVPKNLTDDHKGQRMMTSLDHLRRYAAEGHDFLEGIVTGDESWAYHYTPETKQASMEWKHAGSPVKKKFKVCQSARKVLLTVFWDMHGVLLVDFAEHGTTVNAAAYIKTLVKLRRALRDKRRNINADNVKLLHDNARPHIAASVRRKIERFGWEVLQHPPYSPDLAPSDFHLFGPMKKFLAGQRFATDAEVKSAVRKWLYSNRTEFYEQGILKLVSRWEKCVEKVGDYVEK